MVCWKCINKPKRGPCEKRYFDPLNLPKRRSYKHPIFCNRPYDYDQFNRVGINSDRWDRNSGITSVSGLSGLKHNFKRNLRPYNRSREMNQVEVELNEVKNPFI